MTRVLSSACVLLLLLVLGGKAWAKPPIAILGLEFPALIGGAVITESIFALAGVGQFANKAAQAGNVPAVQGVLVLSIVLVVVFNFIVNIILGRITPAAQRGV